MNAMVKTESDKFKTDRESLNQLVMKYSGKNIKRFYGLDSAVFGKGTLECKTKELIGLVASLTLRCDDCVKYHLDRCREEGVNDAELEEALAIGLVIGGSITIPSLRKAVKYWDDFKQ